MALEISRELLTAKLHGQETVAGDKLKHTATADVIGKFVTTPSLAFDVSVHSCSNSHGKVRTGPQANALPCLSGCCSTSEFTSPTFVFTSMAAVQAFVGALLQSTCRQSLPQEKQWHP